MVEQLTLDGGSVPYPIKVRRLTSRQHDLLLVLTASDEPMATRDVGRLYANPSSVMRRLEGLGLVERVRRGWWRAA